MVSLRENLQEFSAVNQRQQSCEDFPRGKSEAMNYSRCKTFFYYLFLISSFPKYRTDKLINRQGNNPVKNPVGNPSFTITKTK